MAGNIIELHTEVPADLESNVFGQFDEHLKLIERTLNVTVISRDGILKILGGEQGASSAKKLIEELVVLAKRGNTITKQNVNYALSLAMEQRNEVLSEIDKDFICNTIQGRPIKPKTLGQKDYVEQIRSVITALSEKNWKIYALKNYWTNDGFPYNGVNTKFKNPRNYRIEIQFHTKESFDVKMSKEDHDLYEQRRVLEPGCDEYNRILQLQLNLYSNMEYPKNIALLDNI